MNKEWEELREWLESEGEKTEDAIMALAMKGLLSKPQDHYKMDVITDVLEKMNEIEDRCLTLPTE